MSPFRRVLQFAVPYRIYVFLNVLFNIFYSLMSIVSVISFLPILKLLFRDVNEIQQEAVPVEPAFSFGYFQYRLNEFTVNAINDYGHLKVLAWYCIFTVILFLFRNLFRYLAVYFMISLRSGVSRDIRNKLYDKVLQLPVAYFTDQRKGDLLTRIANDVDNVKNHTLLPLVELIRSPFMLVATLFALFFMNASLTLIALCILPVMAIMISRISKSLRKDASKAQRTLGNLLSFVEETLGAGKVIKIFNAEGLLGSRFHEQNTHWRSLTNRVERKYELSSPMSEFLGSITMIALVWYGGKLIYSGDSSMSGEAFITFIGLFFQMLDPAKMLSKSVSDLAKGSASAERVLQVLDADITVKESPNALEINDFKHSIVFEDVSFQYQENVPVLKNFNLTINKGETIALVGQSGSGKTTVANLLARFYDVSSGQILIDGTPIQDLKLSSYRTLLGMVTQEPILFNASVADNILLGKSDATEQEVMDAAQIANAAEFIEQLPNTYVENIGESGGKLSGGQKQRLSIARAVLKNPPIMILDEATSALDSKSERLVQNALEQMMENRTSVVIAHRLSTIQNADKIVVMDQGEIREMGRHTDLLALNGIYARLIEMQNFS